MGAACFMCTYPIREACQLLEIAAPVCDHIRRNHVHLNVRPILVRCLLALANVSRANKCKPINSGRGERSLALGRNCKLVELNSLSFLQDH